MNESRAVKEAVPPALIQRTALLLLIVGNQWAVEKLSAGT